jgi:hypothetical protein
MAYESYEYYYVQVKFNLIYLNVSLIKCLIKNLSYILISLWVDFCGSSYELLPFRYTVIAAYLFHLWPTLILQVRHY